MADIKQAARWIQEGRKVQRVGWNYPIQAEDKDEVDSVIVYAITKSEFADFSTGDLLAEDWELTD